MIELKRPLIFFDLETTGTNISNDRIVELYAKKFFPDGHHEELYTLVNPNMTIPYGAVQVHGITNERVAFEPYLEDLSDQLVAFFKDSDLAGYNVLRFDLPLLAEEFARLGMDDFFDDVHVVDSMLIFYKMVPRTLAGALRYYKDEALDDAHSAKADVLATIEVFEQQMKQHDHLPQSTEAIEAFTLNNKELVDFSGYFAYDDNGAIIFNFGKHKGKLATNEPDYLHWMLNSDFPAQTKRKINKLILNS